MWNRSRSRASKLVLAAGLGVGAVVTVGSTSVGASMPPPVSVSLSPSIGSGDGTGMPVFAGDAIRYNLTVSNSGDTASGPVTVVDKLPAIEATLVAGSVTCGSVPNCTFGLVGNGVSFSLSSVPAGASGLQMSVRVVARPQRNVYDSAKWTGGGCLRWCHTNTLVNPIVAPPVTLSSNPPNRSFVAAGDRIVYSLAVASIAYETGDGDVIIVDAVPPKTAYADASATCGSTPGCTAGEADGIVTFTLGPASFAGGSSVSVSFTAVIGNRVGTIKDRGSWNGGACALLSCQAQPGVDLNAT